MVITKSSVGAISNSTIFLETQQFTVTQQIESIKQQYNLILDDPEKRLQTFAVLVMQIQEIEINSESDQLNQQQQLNLIEIKSQLLPKLMELESELTAKDLKNQAIRSIEILLSKGDVQINAEQIKSYLNQMEQIFTTLSAQFEPLVKLIGQGNTQIQKITDEISSIYGSLLASLDKTLKIMLQNQLKESESQDTYQEMMQVLDIQSKLRNGLQKTSLPNEDPINFVGDKFEMLIQTGTTKFIQQSLGSSDIVYNIRKNGRLLTQENSFNENESENSLNTVYKMNKNIYDQNILNQEDNFHYKDQDNLLYDIQIEEQRENAQKVKLREPLQYYFADISVDKKDEEQNLVCIQEKYKGEKWIADNCEVVETEKNNGLHCKCLDLKPTTLVDDVKQIYKDSSFKDALSEKGIETFLKFQYHKSAIFYIFLFNLILLIIFIIYGRNLDKKQRNKNHIVPLEIEPKVIENEQSIVENPQNPPQNDDQNQENDDNNDDNSKNDNIQEENQPQRDINLQQQQNESKKNIDTRNMIIDTERQQTQSQRLLLKKVPKNNQIRLNIKEKDSQVLNSNNQKNLVQSKVTNNICFGEQGSNQSKFQEDVNKKQNSLSQREIGDKSNDNKPLKKMLSYTTQNQSQSQMHLQPSQQQQPFQDDAKLEEEVQEDVFEHQRSQKKPQKIRKRKHRNSSKNLQNKQEKTDSGIDTGLRLSESKIIASSIIWQTLNQSQIQIEEEYIEQSSQQQQERKQQQQQKQQLQNLESQAQKLQQENKVYSQKDNTELTQNNRNITTIMNVSQNNQQLSVQSIHDTNANNVKGNFNDVVAIKQEKVDPMQEEIYHNLAVQPIGRSFPDMLEGRNIICIFNQQISRPTRFILFFMKYTVIMASSCVFQKYMVSYLNIIASVFTGLLTFLPILIIKIFLYAQRKSINLLGVICVIAILFGCILLMVDQANKMGINKANQWAQEYLASFVLDIVFFQPAVTAIQMLIVNKAIQQKEKKGIINKLAILILKSQEYFLPFYNGSLVIPQKNVPQVNAQNQ